MSFETTPSEIIYSSGATGEADLRLIHYNDVYHIEGGSQGAGAARFVSLVDHYRSGDDFTGQSELLTFFSGDAFNPSLESSVTKGRHMVPILNAIKTDVACLGNHDLDFGVDQFIHLKDLCSFPWLCANVEDPALGEGVSIAGLQKTLILESSNGIKIGVIGLAEREWLDTINSLPPNLKYISASATVKELVPKLREQGAELIVAVTHMREPNDVKLASSTDGLIDIVLGGHDHYYAHQIVNGCHIMRSGSDFRNLSYIEARRNSSDGSVPGWNFDIVKRDITRDTPEDEEMAKTVNELTEGLKSKLEKPIGFTLAPLDARFTTVRLGESNLSNLVCDIMRFYYSTDCAIMAGGTVRGDQIYPPGVIKLGDIINCFPFEDPVVVIKVTGAAIVKALENGVSKVPALEGRFPQVSNINFTYDSSLPEGERILSVKVGEEDVDLEKRYTMSTRGYMANGKDGFNALSPEEGAEVLVDDENGVLISMMLRQYFLSLKVIGKWSRGGTIRDFFGGLKKDMQAKGEVIESVEALQHELLDDDEYTSGSESDIEKAKAPSVEEIMDEDVVDLIQKTGRKWARLAGVRTEEQGSGFNVGWTSAIAPKLEGRIVDVAVKES